MGSGWLAGGRRRRLQGRRQKGRPRLAHQRRRWPSRVGWRDLTYARRGREGAGGRASGRQQLWQDGETSALVDSTPSHACRVRRPAGCCARSDRALQSRKAAAGSEGGGPSPTRRGRQLKTNRWAGGQTRSGRARRTGRASVGGRCPRGRLTGVEWPGGRRGGRKPLRTPWTL